MSAVADGLEDESATWCDEARRRDNGTDVSWVGVEVSWQVIGVGSCGVSSSVSTPPHEADYVHTRCKRYQQTPIQHKTVNRLSLRMPIRSLYLLFSLSCIQRRLRDRVPEYQDIARKRRVPKIIPLPFPFWELTLAAAGYDSHGAEASVLCQVGDATARELADGPQIGDTVEVKSKRCLFEDEGLLLALT